MRLNVRKILSVIHQLQQSIESQVYKLIHQQPPFNTETEHYHSTFAQLPSPEIQRSTNNFPDLSVPTAGPDMETHTSRPAPNNILDPSSVELGTLTSYKNPILLTCITLLFIAFHHIHLPSPIANGPDR